MKWSVLVNVLIVYLLSLQTALAQEQDFSKVELKTTKVAGNIYMLEGVGGFAGGNLGVSVGKDGILLIDDMFAPMSEKIRKALAELGSGELRFVLNTHWHSDHTSGNVEFAQNSTIVAHTNVRKRVMVESSTLFGTVPPLPQEAWPVITFDDSLTIHFNDEAITVLHYPHGHTDGDSVIFFPKSNVVHMGDLFFSGMFPFVDLGNGGNVINYRDNVGAILSVLPDDVKVIPGHGTLSDKKGLQKDHAMLVATTEYVRKKKETGLTLEEIQQQGLPEEFKSWEKGFIDGKTWIGFIYQSLAQGSFKITS